MFVFFKQKPAYEMRISDCSSDVCSSDLGAAIHLDGTSVANTNTSITAANKLAGGVLSHGQDTRVTILNNPSISVAGSGSNTTYMTMAVKVQDGGYISLDGGTVSTPGGTLTRGLYAQMRSEERRVGKGGVST